MNSQFTPGLSESFARQEHQRLLKEAANARLARQATAARPRRSFFSLKRKPAKNANPADTPQPSDAPQPSVSSAATFAVLTGFLAVQFARWVAF